MFYFVYTGGVTGTPTFMLNDVSVAADASWSVDDWSKVIDPLLKAQYVRF
jgi:protein-disulfide isomerase